METQRSGIRWLKRLVWGCLLTATLPATASDRPQICNQTIFLMHVAYGYKSPQGGGWEKQGWWKVQPGHCLTLRPALSNEFFVRAEADHADIVNRAYMRNGPWVWEGDGSDRRFESCVTQQAFHESWEVCRAGWPSRRFMLRTIDRTLYLTSSASSVASLQEAREMRLLVEGQLRYGESIRNAPRGTPFRVGMDVAHDEHSVYVREVIPGMPAFGILYPGDRLLALNGKRIRHPVDFILQIQRESEAAPSDRRFVLDVRRWDATRGVWAAVRPEIGVAYYATLDDRQGMSEFKAAVAGAANGMSFGLAPYGGCLVKGLVDSVIHGKPAHQLDDGCVARSKRERELLYEAHESTAVMFDLGFSFFSPRLALRSLARQAPRRSLRNLAIAVADEAAQGLVYEWGWSKESDRALPRPEVIDGVIQGMAIGATVHLLTGR